MSSRAVRFIAVGLSVVLFATNCAFVHATETALWSERRRALQLASLPAGFEQNQSQLLRQFPSPAASGTLRAQVSPLFLRGAASNAASLVQALPSAYGTVRNISGPSMAAKTVIHIQDVHLNPEAQENIGKALQALIDQKNVGLVALEGAFGPMDFSVFRKFPYPDSTKAVADYLFREKKISGAVYTAFTSQGDIPRFVGVDQRQHYDANVDAYKKSAALIKPYKEQLAPAERKLNAEKRAAFNKDLAEFDAHVQAFRKSTLAWGDYVRFLVKHSPSTTTNLDIFLEALNQESALDLPKVEKERTELITQLVAKLTKERTSELLNASVAYRMGNISHTDFYRYLKDLCDKEQIRLSRYKAMDAYVRYVLLADAIDVEKILSDVDRMEKADYRALARSAEEKRLVDASAILYLTGKLLDFSLTPLEWKEYREFLPMSSNGEAGRGMSLESFEKFYTEAEARDEAMTANLMKAMDQSRASVAVLVTGGFHAQGIDERLKQKGFATISYVPKISKVDDETGSAYLSVFTQEKTPLDKLFAGEKLFVTPPVMVSGASAEVLVELHVRRIHGTDLRRALPDLPPDADLSVNGSRVELKSTTGDVSADVKPTTIENVAVSPHAGRFLTFAGFLAIVSLLDLPSVIQAGDPSFVSTVVTGAGWIALAAFLAFFALRLIVSIFRGRTWYRRYVAHLWESPLLALAVGGLSTAAAYVTPWVLDFGHPDFDVPVTVASFLGGLAISSYLGVFAFARLKKALGYDVDRYNVQHPTDDDLTMKDEIEANAFFSLCASFIGVVVYVAFYFIFESFGTPISLVRLFLFSVVPYAIVHTLFHSHNRDELHLISRSTPGPREESGTDQGIEQEVVALAARVASGSVSEAIRPYWAGVPGVSPEQIAAAQADVAAVYAQAGRVLKTPQAREQFDRSFALHVILHADQPRASKGDSRPYVIHVAGVMKLLLEEFRLLHDVSSPDEVRDILSAVWLHDTIEDAKKGRWGKARFAALGGQEGALRGEVGRLILVTTNSRVRGIVEALSKPNYEGLGLTDEVAIEARYYTDLADKPLGTQLIKAADFAFNLGDLKNHPDRAFPQKFFTKRLAPVLGFLPVGKISPRAKARLVQFIRASVNENNEKNLAIGDPVNAPPVLTAEQERLLSQAEATFLTTLAARPVWRMVADYFRRHFFGGLLGILLTVSTVAHYLGWPHGDGVASASIFGVRDAPPPDLFKGMEGYFLLATVLCLGIMIICAKVAAFLKFIYKFIYNRWIRKDVPQDANAVAIMEKAKPEKQAEAWGQIGASRADRRLVDSAEDAFRKALLAAKAIHTAEARAEMLETLVHFLAGAGWNKPGRDARFLTLGAEAVGEIRNAAKDTENGRLFQAFRRAERILATAWKSWVLDFQREVVSRQDVFKQWQRSRAPPHWGDLARMALDLAQPAALRADFIEALVPHAAEVPDWLRQELSEQPASPERAARIVELAKAKSIPAKEIVQSLAEKEASVRQMLAANQPWWTNVWLWVGLVGAGIVFAIAAVWRYGGKMIRFFRNRPHLLVFALIGGGLTLKALASEGSSVASTVMLAGAFVPFGLGRFYEKQRELDAIRQLAAEIHSYERRPDDRARLISSIETNLRGANRGDMLFHVGYAVGLQFNTESAKLNRACETGFALTVREMLRAGSAFVASAIGGVFDTRKEALAAAFSTHANVVTIVYVNDENDLPLMDEAFMTAAAHNETKRGRGAASLAVVGVVVARGADADFVESVHRQVAALSSSVPISVLKEEDIPTDELTDVFAQFAPRFLDNQKAQTLFSDLSINRIEDKRVVSIGATKTPYKVNARLLSILISILPRAGRYLLINFGSLLEAAIMA